MPKIIENIREIILEKGKEMLLEESYGNFNIRKLAKNTGLGLGTLYNYFENKEMLIYQIFISDWEHTIELASQMKGEDLPLNEKLRRIYDSLDTFVSQYMSVFREMAEGTSAACPHDRYEELHQKISDLLMAENTQKSLDRGVSTEKMAYFIMTSMLNNVKSKHLTFDELMACINL